VDPSEPGPAGPARRGAGAPRRRIRAGALSLFSVLLLTAATLGLGAALKQPCASGNWSDGRQYRWLCYSDVVPLLGTEHLSGDRLPFLDSCPPSPGQCDEYPVLTMYLMRTAAWTSTTFTGFFWANAALLSLAALLAAAFLHRMSGDRALFFAVAPTLLIFAFVNWDLLAVALATGATLAYVTRRDSLSGILLGLGAAAKLYPWLLVVPFALGRVREGRRGTAATLTVWAAVAYGAVNLPFLLGAPHAWWTFFRFNAQRAADWDSLWFVACTRLHDAGSCSWSPRMLNVLSFLLLVALAALVWTAKTRIDPDFPRWTFGFPLLVAFLLTNKVYSPQYGLWLLPWFALALPNVWLFAMFEAADVAVFVTRFTWFGRLAADGGDPAFAGFSGAPLGAFQIALVVRALVLLVCLVAWVRRREALPAPVRAGPAAKTAAVAAEPS
jgi:uncharacterized membrane protein